VAQIVNLHLLFLVLLIHAISLSAKKCILTITRPNGASRSYATEPVFSRKNEAKAHVAALAIEMGAIEFIVSGYVDTPKGKKGLVLAPLDAPDSSDIEAAETSVPTLPFQDGDAAIQQIEECCTDWRAGVVKPEWIPLTEPKLGTSSRPFVLVFLLQSYPYLLQNMDALFVSNSQNILTAFIPAIPCSTTHRRLREHVHKLLFSKACFPLFSLVVARSNLHVVQPRTKPARWGMTTCLSSDPSPSRHSTNSYRDLSRSPLARNRRWRSTHLGG
jgi:hypothetical protein